MFVKGESGSKIMSVFFDRVLWESSAATEVERESDK